MPSRVVYRCEKNAPFVVPNVSNAGASFSNQFATGRVLVKTRTDPLSPSVANYFEGRNRMFEYQVQFQLLQPLPDDWNLYIGAEIDNDLNFGFGGRLVVSTILGCLRLFTSKMNHSFGNAKTRESAHLVFPFSLLPDNLTVTKEGDIPPELTLGELKTGEKAQVERLEPGNIYTLSFYSQYVDFETWTICRVPGMRSLPLSSFWGDSGLHVCAYALPPECGDQHDTSKRRMLLDVELLHSSLPSFPNKQ